MHKGYTTTYFIDFFSKIPNSRWTTGSHEEGNLRDALGHCMTNQRTGVMNRASTARANALQRLLSFKAAAINDGDGAVYRKLGKTPRARILRALRNRRSGRSPF